MRSQSVAWFGALPVLNDALSVRPMQRHVPGTVVTLPPPGDFGLPFESHTDRLPPVVVSPASKEPPAIARSRA